MEAVESSPFSFDTVKMIGVAAAGTQSRLSNEQPSVLHAVSHDPSPREERAHPGGMVAGVASTSHCVSAW